ncbi:hypothetical protein [Dokdonia sp.]|uniref:hypothetical protein n=1 Tax=Dokdonia sp. TaxID=2024995 RepID=UPI0032649999
MAQAEVDYNHPNPLVMFSMRQKAKDDFTKEEIEEAFAGYTNTGINELLEMYFELRTAEPDKYPFSNDLTMSTVVAIKSKNTMARHYARINAGLNETEAHVIENARIAREKSEFYKTYDSGKHYQSRVKDKEVKMPLEWFLLEEMEREIIANGRLQSKYLKTYFEEKYYHPVTKPTYGSQIDENKNGMGISSLNPEDYGLKKGSDLTDPNFCFAENYQDISLGRWVTNGIKKAVKFIQTL